MCQTLCKHIPTSFTISLAHGLDEGLWGGLMFHWLLPHPTEFPGPVWRGPRMVTQQLLNQLVGCYCHAFLSCLWQSLEL